MQKQLSPMSRKQRAQLGAFVRRKRTARRAVCDLKRDTSLELGLRDVTHQPYEPVGFHFIPRRHGLTLEQCRLATQLLRRANRERPITARGKRGQFLKALRIAGVVSAVKGGRVGNSHFGYSLHGHRGGNVMRDHALHHLRAISPRGRHAAQAARERKKALQHWERTGQVLPLGKYEEEYQAPLPQRFQAWEQR